MKNITIVDSNPAKSMSPFFIVSTGRSGTKSIADYFTRCTNSICLHEPEPKLIAESSGYRYGNIPENDIHEILSRTRVKPVHDQIYGESNQTLSLIIPILRKAYPTSKFIWLIRNGLDVVASAAGRGWYTGSLFNKDYESLSNVGQEWVNGRIQGDQCGSVSEKAWTKMSAFEKCCWYWSYINSTIDDDLNTFVGEFGFKTVRLEYINQTIIPIVNWIGLNITRSEHVQILNRAKSKHIYHHSNWAYPEWLLFEKWCGPLMDRFYPEWRKLSKVHHHFTDTARHSENAPYPEIKYHELISTVSDKTPNEKLAVIKAFLSSCPNCAIAHNDLAVISMKQGDHEAAAHNYEKALNLEPQNTTFLKNQADFNYFYGGKTESAFETYKRLYKCFPNDPEVLFGLGKMFQERGNFSEARRLYETILVNHPKDKDAHTALRLLQRNVPATDFLTNEIFSKPLNPLFEELDNRLNYRGWQSKKGLYQKYIESIEKYRWANNPAISIVTISWRFDTDTLETFRRLQNERNLNFELIFVDNGGQPNEFDSLKLYIDTYIRLNQNTGAYLARNVGALFAEAPIIFFLEDDGLPAEYLIAGHLNAFRRYDVLSVRGVCLPKTKTNPLNLIARHYYLGDKPFPHIVNLEGNASYDSAAFFKVGGWDDNINFGGGGPELAYRLLQYDSNYGKQIYCPAPIIYHDYADNDSHLQDKRLKQTKSMKNLLEKHTDFKSFIDSWSECYRQTEIIPLSESFSDSGEVRKDQTGGAVISTTSNLRVSIVIPTFNRAVYLSKALESAIAQTYPADEILVIDDASTDDTPEVVQSIKHDRVRYVRKEHSGAPSTRNRGIIEAKGDYVLWLDDDDILLSDAIETHMALLKANPETDVAYGVLQKFDSKSGIELNRFNPDDWSIFPDMLCASMLKGCAIPNPGTIVRRSAYDRLGEYDVTFPRAHDYEFWSRSLTSLKFKKNYSIVCRYRIHSDNMSAGTFIDRSFESQIMRKMLHRYGLHNIYHWLNWEEPEAANTVALYMASGNFLNIGDTYNALRLIEEIPAHFKSADICDLHLRALLYQGKTREAWRILNSLSANAIMNADELITLRTNFDDHIKFHKTLNASFSNQDFRTTQKMLQMLDDEGRLIPADQIMAFCDQHRHSIPEKMRLKILQSAITQNPTCENLQKQALGLVRKQEARESLDATRCRVLDPIVESQTTNTQSVKAMGFRPKKSNDFSKLTIQHDENISNLYEDACRFYDKGNYLIAFETLNRAIALQPNHWEAYDLLVNVMLQSGEETAIPAQLRPLEGRSDLPARMLALIGSGYEAANDLVRAAAFTGQALAIDAGCALAWNLKGVLSYRNGNLERAARFFQKASECDADWGDPWANMGTLHCEKGSHDKALDCYEEGFLLSPTAPNIATTYHIAISETGQFERAKPLFDKAVKHHPNFRKGRFLLIDILIRMKAYQEALTQIEAVMVRFGVDSQFLEAAKTIRNKVGPMTIEKGKHSSLSLCMIVKNEEKCLPRCLESLKPVVDEMIVVDTGSTDSTIEIAELFGARTFDFKWNDDFSAARNYSLEQASGDWILVMDADEVISPKDHTNILKLLTRTKSKRHAFMIVTRNYTDQYNIVGWEPNLEQYPEEEAGAGWVPSKKVRLFPNDKNIRFEYAVHEVIGPSLFRSNIPVESCPHPVHHYGKLDIVRERHKDEHYFKIGMKKLSLSQNDPVPIREMAIQAAKLGKLKDSNKLWKRLIELQPKNGKSYINLASNCLKMGRYLEARNAALKAVKLSPNIKEGFLNLGLSELHLGNIVKAENIFEKLVKKHSNYYSAVFFLGSSQLCQGNIEKGLKTLQYLKTMSMWENLSYAIQDLVESLVGAGWIESSRNLIFGSEALNCSNYKIKALGRQLEMQVA